ncbi:MAG: hypothetical protein K9K76_11510 [Halanaerobiales bacterium]|nr:hypothetical protein [Halanaerobiales bacterium]
MKLEYTTERAYCNDCNEEIYISELHDHNIQKIDDTYREKAGIIKVPKLKEILKQYNTDKRQLSLILCNDEKTLTRYMDGDIPSKSNSKTLKKIKEDYKFIKQLAEKNRHKVTDDAINNLIKDIKSLQQKN